ncbi:glycosyltransferase family 2 protein [Bacillus cereus]|uniref:glycosyltransferase family 2 protein n=1 Tax=Bacillus cereus group TaxID=86661 RepID=UPI00192DD781|nr:glycosyltransferase [Bacillus cereus]MDA2327530.1 glycosyltransferase [Bacillus cereus]MDA2333745.1 glycosyltransferase [Bacillus cereus]MDA2355777.1 glycosyltransferase [Bacillus cereus]
MSSNVKISIIIPVYNVENYVGRCIESICNQTLKEIEVIVVNDGSTDRSLEIVDSYRDLDSRVICVNQKNLGVSAARNQGINIATGEYVTFVDGDDYIEETMLEEMYRMAEEERSNLIFCNLSNQQKVKRIETVHYETSEKCIENMIDGEMPRTACGILFSLKLIKENDVIFDTDMPYGEDFLFTIKSLLLTNEKIGVLSKEFYRVEERAGSATRCYNANRFREILLLNQRIQVLLESAGLFDKLKEFLMKYYLQNILSSVTNIVMSEEAFSIKLTRLREVKENNHTKNILNLYSNIGVNRKTSFKVFLLKHTNAYFLWFFYTFYRKNKG